LSAARQGVVPGFGRSGALLLVVGDYSWQQEPFSATVCFGEAEDPMLWNMMRAIGLTPAEVYVTNAVKCCPLSGEVPTDDCLRSCRAHLIREIERVQPRVVCAMGDLAARTLLGGEEPVLRLRGRFHTLRASGDGSEPLPLMVTLHPRFLLKNAEMKKAAWQDLQMIQRLLDTR
jgi:DNA polymerase